MAKLVAASSPAAAADAADAAAAFWLTKAAAADAADSAAFVLLVAAEALDSEAFVLEVEALDALAVALFALAVALFAAAVADEAAAFWLVVAEAASTINAHLALSVLVVSGWDPLDVWAVIAIKILLVLVSFTRSRTAYVVLAAQLPL